MPITFTCPHCGAQTNVDDQYAGQSGPCASCGQRITIPGGSMPAYRPPKPRSSTSTLVIVLAIFGVGGLCIIPVLIGLLLPAVQAAREAARRAQSTNNMRQIGVAIVMHEGEKHAFPAAYSADAAGKPLLSWRVHLLPYLDRQDLYAQFHLDEPWDSPHNKALIPLMPTVYRNSSSNAGLGQTTYLTPRGPNTLFPGGTPIGSDDIPDGRAQTIMLVEADDSRAVEWTRPDDYDVDPQDPAKGLIGARPRGFLVGMADGSVHIIPNDVDRRNLQGLFTRNGSEPVSVP